MLTKEIIYSFKTPIDLFTVVDESVLIVQGNVLKIIEETGSRVLFECDNPIDRLLVNGSNIFVVDWHANTFKINKNGITMLSGGLHYLFPDGKMISHFQEPKRTALLDPEGNVLWELGFRSLQFLFDHTRIFFQDNSNRSENRIVAVQRLTGQELWSCDSKVVNFELNKEQKFQHLIGTYNNKVFVTLSQDRYLISIDASTGRVEDQSCSVEHIDTMKLIGLTYDLFKIDSEQALLVHPLAEIRLSDMDLSPRYSLKQHLESDQETHVIPSVLPFAFNRNLIFFGVQVLMKNDNDYCRYDLVGISRKFGEVVFRQPVNEKKEIAGIKQMILQGEKLFLLDSLGNLTIYRLKS